MITLVTIDSQKYVAERRIVQLREWQETKFVVCITEQFQTEWMYYNFYQRYNIYVDYYVKKIAGKNFVLYYLFRWQITFHEMALLPAKFN